MKKIITLFIALLPLAVLAQLPFTISARVPSFKDGDKIYLIYHVKDAKFADSTVVKNGAFGFKGTIKGIGVGYMCRNDNPFTADILHDPHDIYIEPGYIVINNADSLKNAEITGTAINQDYAELTKSLRQLHKRFIQANETFDALPAEKREGVQAMADLQNKLRAINMQMEPVKLAFIKTHPNSYMSLATLAEMVNKADVLKLDEAYKGLAPSAKSTELGASVGKLIASAMQSRVGATALDFTLPNSAGKPVKLSSFKGKYVLVDFWASWCYPCRRENPNVKEAYQKYKAKGFTVLSVSLDNIGDKAAWLGAIKKDELPWTQVLDEGKKVKEMYGVTTIPNNALIDPSGKIIARNIKEQVLQDTLATLFSGK